MSVAAIKRLLPHRHPLLLLDRITEGTDGDSLRAVKAVTVSEPCYARLADDADHAYPTALVLESWCQAAAVLVLLRLADEVGCAPLTLLGGLRDVTLSGEARPGDVLEHHVRLVRMFDRTAIAEGMTAVAGTGEIMRVGSVTVSLQPADVLIRTPEGRSQL